MYSERYHGGDCYACDAPADGVRDRRPEGHDLESACKRHKDPKIKAILVCIFCDGIIRRGAYRVEREYAHVKCHKQECSR